MLTTRAEATPWHDHMDMGMVGHCGPPCMQDSRDANPGPQMLVVSGNGHQCLRGGFEQEVIDHRLVVPSDIADLAWQSEDHMEVAKGQQVLLSPGQPVACSCPLTLGAVPVATAVVGDLGMITLGAAFDMTAKDGGPARLDG